MILLNHTFFDLNSRPKMNPKVLCFTSSIRRPKMLRGCIRDILQQSYPNTWHGINFAYSPDDVSSEAFANNALPLDDLDSDGRLKIAYNENAHNHINFLNAIKAFDNYLDFDIYVKVDNDDIYKSNYVKNIVEFMQKNDCDICSTKTKWELNGFNLYKSTVDNLGGNPEGTDFNMPPTFAFNKKALQALLEGEEKDWNIGWEDKFWRVKWANDGLKHLEIDNGDQFLWNIHGSNASIGHWLKIGGVPFGTHFAKLQEAYKAHGRHQGLLKNIWFHEEKFIVFEMPTSRFDIGIIVHSNDLTKLKVGAFDRSKKLKFKEVHEGYDFRRGSQMTIFEAMIKTDEEYVGIVHAIDTFMDLALQDDLVE